MASNLNVVENDDNGTVETISNFADDREVYPYISDPKLLTSTLVCLINIRPKQSSENSLPYFTLLYPTFPTFPNQT